MSSGVLAGIGLTRLQVYDQRPAPDGTLSGCAHVHACTDEAYYVIAGRGAIELHDLERGFRRVPLQAGDFVQFGPGTLHRSVNEAGLDILALMSHSGLAERGDARIYFGAAVDADPAAFERLRDLPRTHGLDGALQRRDASVRAYAELLRLWHEERDAYFAELRRFVELHRRQAASLERPHGAAPTVAATGGVLRDERPQTLGMCGLLRQLPEPTPL